MRILISAILIGLVAAPTARAQDDDETAAIRATLEHYLAGHATGDGAHFQAAFHAVANLYWVAGDTLAHRTSAAYITGASGQPAADEAQRRRRIVSIDRAGTAAMAKIELDYPTVRFVDYMSLLKIDGRWLIVNKIFHREPKARP